MTTRTSLVTGGAGFIGSNLVDSLLARGDRVALLDDLSTGRIGNLDGAIGGGAELIEGDIRDPAIVLGAFSKYRPSTVFHLAAQIDVRRSVEDPAFDAAVNVLGTANVLEANRATANARFVFASTGGAIYGEGAGQDLPLTEDAPPAPMSPYAQGKLAAESYLSLYHRLYGTECIALRLGNVYGPRQDPFGEAGVVAILCGKLVEGERPTIYGSGLQTRDYVHVDDVVKAMLAAGTSVANGPLNIGTGIERSVLDLVESLTGRRDPGVSFEPEFAPARAGEIERISLDPSRAAVELGWTAAIGLDEGLARTLASVEPVLRPD